MPTTSALRLNSGPPELPGFTATSVWMKGTYCALGNWREVALTIRPGKKHGWPTMVWDAHLFAEWIAEHLK